MHSKNKIIKIALGLNGFIFLMGGIVLIGDKKITFAIIQLTAAIMNLSLLFNFKNKKTIIKLKYAILIMNIIVCISTGIDAILSHKNYIQYVWFFAAIVAFIALVSQIKTIINQKNQSPA